MRHVAMGVCALILFMAPAPVLSAVPGGDAAAGKAAFGRCSGCHSLAPGENGLGPSLNGIAGRPVASARGFAYSQALQSSKGRAWSPQLLDTYLASPNAMFPGNRMGIAVTDPKTRADIVAYLRTVKGR